MRRFTIEILPQAERDLLAIGAHLADQAGQNTARKWIDKFESAILLLSENPEIGAQSDLLGAGRRRLVLRPYLIVYRIKDPNLVRVIRIVDGRRDLPALFAESED